MRPPSTETLLKKLKGLELITVKNAEKLGVSSRTLYRLAEDDHIQKVGHGLFLPKESSLQAEEVDFAVACKSLGKKSVIGGLTALFHYRLTEEPPRQIWVMVPPSKRSWKPVYRCIRAQTPLHKEIVDHGTYRITNLERTLIEALRYSSKIGLQVALKAVRTALTQKMTTPLKLESAAKNLKLLPQLLKHWEAITA